MKRLAVKFGVNLARVYGCAALNLILVGVLMAQMSLEDFGRYSYVIAVCGLLQLVTLTGMETAVSQFVSEGRHEIYLPVLLLRAKLSFVASLGIVVCGAGYSFVGDSSLASSFWLMSVLFPMQSVFLHQSYLLAKKRINEWALVDVLAKSVSVFSVFLMVKIFGELLIVYVLFAVFVPRIIAYAISLLFSLRRDGLVLKQQVPKSERDYIIRRSVVSLVPFSESRVDGVIIGGMFDYTSLALYSAAKNVRDLIKQIIMSIRQIALPYMQVMNVMDMRSFCQKYTPLLFVLVCGFSLVVYLVVGELVERYFPKYRGIQLYLIPVLIGLSFNTWCQLYELLLTCLRKVKLEFFSHLFASSAYLGSLVVFCVLGNAEYLAYAFVIKAVVLVVIVRSIILRSVDLFEKN